MKIFKKLLLFTTLTLWSFPLLSQATFVDSLKIVVPDATFSERIKIKYKVGPYLKNIVDIDERLQQAQRYVEVATTLKDSFFMENAYYQLGRVYKALEDTLNSQQAFDLGKTIATQYGWSLGDNHSETGGVTSTRNFTEVYKDNSRQMSFDSIRLRPTIFELNTIDDNVDTNAVYWSRLKLRGHEEKTDEYLFQISSDYWGKNSWNKIAAYLVHEDGRVEKQLSGFAINKEEKAIPFPANLLRYTIGQNEKAVLFLRLEGVNEERKPSTIPILLVNDGHYFDTKGGYEFGGQFTNDFGYPYSIVSNYIYHHEIVEDSSGVLEINNISKDWLSLNRKDWMAIQPEVDKVYWLKAKFIGSPIFNGEQVIHITDWAAIDVNTFDYIDAYIPDGKGGFHHQRTGDKVPLKERPYHFWATFLKIDVPLNDTVELFVRLEGIDAQLKSRRIMLTHIDESSIWPDQINKALFSGIILGIFVVQFLYLFFLFLIEKEWIHFYLSAFILGCFLVNFYNTENFNSFVALPFLKELVPQFNWLSLLLVFFGLIKFTQTYFNTPKSWRISKWVIPIYLSLLAILILILCLNLDFDLGNTLNHLLIPLLITTGILLSLYLVFTSKKQAHVSKRFYLIAFLPFIFVVLAFPLMTALGKVLDDQSAFAKFLELYQTNLNETFEIFFPLSQVFALVMLALIAGKRNKGLKVEREKALQKNLDDQKRNYEAQQQVNQAISRFVPNAFLSALGKNNITEITLGDTVEKEVTVFFSDIRNYTALAEKMTPQENFQFVNTYNGRMGPIIQKHQGFINQYLGDGIMAIFPNTTSDALRAAIEMQHAIQNYNQERKAAGKRSIKVGMGMHDGSLIMGIIGDKNRMDAATISDSVNAASRIENLTKHYGASILLSEESLNKLDNPADFNCRYLGQVQVKGKQAPIKIYECFDGDLPASIELKLATLTNFNKGVQAYFQQEFEQATYAFEAVLQQHSTDATAKLFLTKAKRLRQAGVEKDWTGIEQMEKY